MSTAADKQEIWSARDTRIYFGRAGGMDLVGIAGAEDKARIVAAAPEMLAALLMLDSALEAAWKSGDLPASVLTGELVRSYRAAIKKATTPSEPT